MVESLVFLKVNRKYWEQASVTSAMATARSEKVARKLREDSDREAQADM